MSRTLIVIDTETTGYSPESACIWQIAAVALRDGRVAGEWMSRVQPLLWAFTARHREVPVKVSGLSERDLLSLLDAPPADVVARRLLEFIAQAAGGIDYQLAAYNVGFDSRFLERRPWYFTAPEVWAPCLMERAKEAMRLGRWPKLGAACQHYGIPYHGSHDALHDARCAAQLWLALERAAGV